MRADGIGFYHVHAPIDHHPEISPSRMCAAGDGGGDRGGVPPDRRGDPGRRGGDRAVGRDPRRAGGPAPGAARPGGAGDGSCAGARTPMRRAGSRWWAAEAPTARRSQAALERGCETYVTGGVFTKWAEQFLALAESSGIAVVDGTHYGTEKPPQLAMVEWFRAPRPRPPSSSPTARSRRTPGPWPIAPRGRQIDMRGGRASWGALFAGARKHSATRKEGARGGPWVPPRVTRRPGWRPGGRRSRAAPA